eukprot:s923_g4.t1
MAGQGSDASGPLKYFSGEAEDSKEYRRWKTWVQNKLLTLDKLPKASHGAFIYTLLTGKALEAVEHLEPELYQVTDGDKVLWSLLDARFPQKESVDELGEILGEVFSLKVKEGENMKMRAARSQEVFDRCGRKTGVKFPEQARGWIILHRSGLSDEQKAVVIARAGGDLNREAICTALRSCYPDFSAKKKPVALVEEAFPVEDVESADADIENDFQDVQDLLQDHQLPHGYDAEDFPEGDVAEVLAASWREKRQELNRLQKSRQFGKLKEVKRSFRVEVEELKARTTCHRCGKKGHWARECNLPKGSGKGGKSTTANTGSSSGAAMVASSEPEFHDFVAAVTPMLSLVEQARLQTSNHAAAGGFHSVALVSSPGFGVLDSGCGRTIVGESTLQEFEKLWRHQGVSLPDPSTELHQFKYGNGEVETSSKVIALPVCLAGRKGVIKASIVRGQAPLLVSRTALKTLGASLDFKNDTLQVFDQQVPLQTNQAGQYIVDLMGSPADASAAHFSEVMSCSTTPSMPCPEATIVPPAEQVPEPSDSQEFAPVVEAQGHQARYGMQLPHSEHLIRKSTRLLVNRDDMKVLGLLCPGASDPKHKCHDVIRGSAPGVPSVSAYAGAYPLPFVHAVLETVPAFQTQPVLSVLDDAVSPDQWEEVCAAAQTDVSEIAKVLKRLHQNLGHPPNADMVRVLRHAQASQEAIDQARSFECSFCKSQVKPGVPLPAQATRIHEFNHQLGIDVKNLPGWLPNQKIKALNMVDTASGFQRMVPFFQTEKSELLRQLLAEHWIAWAGPPKEIVLDPAATNLGDPLVVPCEFQGCHIRPIAAGAHWQLGKTESHGGWFAHVLGRVIEEHQPRNRDEWLSCVHHTHIKNQMIQVHGFSPQQFVFGKGVHIPEDLLSEPLSIVPATASLTEEGLAKSQAMRASARVALAKLQDDRALRVALLARPRRSYDFKPGDTVAYWRDQKWTQGQLQLGGRWYGPAVVIGSVGRNLVLFHRKQLLRCAPEQIRPSTSEEKQLLNTPHAELLGIKNMVEQGNLQSRNYIDLVPQSYPPMQELSADEAREAGHVLQQSVNVPVESHAPDTSPAGQLDTENIVVSPNQVVDSPMDVTAEQSTNLHSHVDQSSSTLTEQPQIETADETSAPSSYGPIRRRITGKDGPLSLFRPPAMKQDDFVDVMKEVVPQLIEQAIMSENVRTPADKRPVGDVEHVSGDVAEPAVSRARTTEVLSVQDCTDLLALYHEVPSEVFMAEYLRKKMDKELRHSKNEPALQKKVDDGKRVEWDTLMSKENAIRLHYGKAAADIKRHKSDRFIGSRFVLTRKPVEEGKDVNPEDLSSFNVKGRWCLQGHLDPDLRLKAEEGLLKSPTLSQLGRMLLMQVISSNKWQLQLGDIKGAFLEAGPLAERFKPLFAHQPPGGIPGVPSDAVIEVLGNVYGQNDAPAAWFREFDTVVQQLGWIQSKLDPCLYTLREDGRLTGIMGVHVDDTALGGNGPKFTESIQRLRQRFPYRKWRIGTGEFCGAWYSQAADFGIKMNMESFAEKIKPINIPKGSQPDDVLNDSQIRVLRAVNGSLNWLSSQSRPDLAVQTSLSQQSFPKPTIGDLRRANQAVRRAKQEKDLGLQFAPIPLDELTVVCHSDAAWANVGSHTQAGYIIGFTQKCLQDGQIASWCPVTWRSYKLPRAVNSTLGAEAQAFATASSTVEWLLLLLAETLDGPLDIAKCREALGRRRPVLAVLIQARDDGTLGSLLSSIHAEPHEEFELLSEPGAMTDASKRRMTSPPVRLEAEAAMSGGNQKMVGDSPAASGTKLPRGVKSVEHWSLTLLTVGKYGKDGFTYGDLFSSPHQTHRSYVSWLLTQKHRVDLTAPMKDLIGYLNVRSEATGSGEECFEGSTVRRQFRDA